MSSSEEDRRVVSTSGTNFVFVTEHYTGPPPLPMPPDDDEDDMEDQGGDVHAINDGHATSLAPSIATLCNSAIGAGVLSLPLVFKSTGIIGGLLLCLVVAGVEAFTLFVLAKMSERYQQQSYSGLVRAVLGKKTAALQSVLVAIYMWGACVAYLIICSTCLLSIVGALVVGLNLNRALVISAVAVALAPLCLLKRITALSALSSVAIVGFVYTSIAIVVYGVSVVKARPEPFEGINLSFTNLQSYLFAIPIVVFGFNCHANVVVVMHEMETTTSDQPHVPLVTSSGNSGNKSKKLLSMISVIVISVCLIAAGYICVGVAGYATFLDETPSNILQSLPQGETWAILARLLIFIVVFGHYPLSHHPARSSFESICPGYSILFTLCFVASSAIIACAVTDLGAVLHLLGGTVASLIIFLLPGLMLMNSAVVKDSRENISRLSTVTENMNEPLLEELRRREVKGLKTGLVYSPRKSWIAGLFLVLVASSIMILTIGQLASTT